MKNNAPYRQLRDAMRAGRKYRDLLPLIQEDNRACRAWTDTRKAIDAHRAMVRAKRPPAPARPVVLRGRAPTAGSGAITYQEGTIA